MAGCIWSAIVRSCNSVHAYKHSVCFGYRDVHWLLHCYVFTLEANKQAMTTAHVHCNNSSEFGCQSLRLNAKAVTSSM